MKATLNDLKLELWLRNRNSGNIKWKIKSGEDISIKDMSDNHLINTIKMLENNERNEDLFYEALNSIGDNDFIFNTY